MTVKNYLIKKLSIFNISDFSPRGKFKELLTIFSAWAIPAFLFVLWSSSYYPDVKFYEKAITEGIGPNLWNAIGSFGIFSFGLALVFLPYTTPSFVAKQILLNTYAIGCLTFGLLVGQWCLLPFGELEWWQQGLFGFTSVFLLFLVLVYNLVIWYLSFLIQNDESQKSAFLIKFEQLHWAWRVCLGSFISTLAFLAFLNA